jgi:hypothetical protein
LPPRTAEEPSQAAERAEILRRLGREGESRQIASRLNAIGYREAS